MPPGNPPDHVAEDFKKELEDLTWNSKFIINNLTVIAGDYSGQALSIARVLENHIQNTQHKIPALYVLDSIAKNIGSPYTHFFAQNLYRTFMNAYSLLEPKWRKKLEEMLKTWKEPVPGSVDSKPVFSPENLRPIETALIRFRTIDAKQQQQQQQQRPHPDIVNQLRQSTTPALSQWRSTPTPPQSNNNYPPPLQGHQQPSGQNGFQQHPSYPQYQYPQPQHQPASSAYHPPYQQQFQATNYVQPPAPQDLDSLLRDIESLVSKARNEFVASPYDTSVQNRLKALLDLQTILRSQQLPPDQMQAVRNQVTQLSQTPNPIAHTPMPAAVQAPINSPAPVATPTSYTAPPQTPQPPVDLNALLNSNNLTDLLASVAKAKERSSTPSVPVMGVHPPTQPTSVSQAPVNSVPAPSSDTTSLLASLRAAGILTPNTGMTINGATSSAQSSHLFPPPQQMKTVTPPTQIANLARPALAEIQNDVELTNASLKIPRPHLIRAKLFEARPNQCSTCGQRFLATEEGKTKKARHLDWHFRTNQRLADSAKRIQSRSWYVDAHEWYKSRDIVDEDPAAVANGIENAQALAAAAAAKNDPKNKFIPVPSDSALKNAPCPICQEKFDTSWSDEEQDFVWRDAIQVGAKVYHASCYAELKKDGGNTPLRTSTPDSVLGKRKAGVSDLNSPRTKVQKSPHDPITVVASSA
ncbi:MAG: hypothetical protein Q9167_001409 [Letrouitia subvulpina]